MNDSELHVTILHGTCTGIVLGSVMEKPDKDDFSGIMFLTEHCEN
jgi:hypothetical protein